MKKIISVLLAVVMVFGVLSVSVGAQVLSYEGTEYEAFVVIRINGIENNSDFTQEWSKSDDGLPVVTIRSTKYDVVAWRISGLVEGVDYRIVSQDERMIVLAFLKAKAGTFYIDAYAPDAPNYTGVPDDSSTSPDTGADAVAAGALVLAGIAVLALSLKKRRA